MGEMHRSHARHDTSFRLVAKQLRDEGEQVTQKPLPQRWVDLIHYLNEQERKQSELPRAEAQSERALNTEVCNEILDTNEPTDKTRALLESLRRAVKVSSRTRS